MSLRDRRRIETESSIRHAALEIFRDRGPEALTVEAIAAASGISLRTFFNYFPYKEAALTLPPPSFPADAAADFAAAEGALRDDLIALLVAQAQGISEHRWIFPLVADIAEAFPKVVPLQAAQFHAFDAQLAGLIAARTGRSSDDLGCRVLASACLAASKTAIDAWLAQDAGPLDPWLERALTQAFDIAIPRPERP